MINEISYYFISSISVVSMTGFLWLLELRGSQLGFLPKKIFLCCNTVIKRTVKKLFSIHVLDAKGLQIVLN